MIASSQPQQPVPQDIHVSEDEDALYIRWQDNHLGIWSFAYLRGACPCATCKGRHEPRDIAHIVPIEGAFLVDYWTQGNYALRLLWSDAHDTGIYRYEYLRSLCRCDQCS